MLQRNLVTTRAFGRQAVLVAALALGGCAVLQPLSDQPATRGHAVAKRACGACHAVEPGAASPRLAAPAFSSAGMRHTSGLEGRVAQLARLGHYGMPPLKLSPTDARDVTAYIQSLGGS